MRKPVSILAADIGGTNARFAVFAACVSPQLLTMKTSLRLTTAEYLSFAALIGEATARLGKNHDITVIAVPGPVTSFPVTCPNIRWTIDPEEIADLAPLSLLNDFAAQAWATGMPIVQNLRHICGPERKIDKDFIGIIAVTGGGTGMGCGIALHRGAKPPVIFPSEFGHSLLPLLPEDYLYAQFLRKNNIRPDGDNLLSGRGISTLCDFATGRRLQPDAAAEALPDDMWKLLSKFYGRAVQQLALTAMPLAGICISGGIVNRHPRIVTDPSFATALYDCLGYESFLRGIPVDLVRNDDAALWGAAFSALQTYIREMS